MKTARDVALDVVSEIMGRGFSKNMIGQMATDDSDAGRDLAKMLRIIEKHVEADRARAASLRAPS